MSRMTTVTSTSWRNSTSNDHICRSSLTALTLRTALLALAVALAVSPASFDQLRRFSTNRSSLDVAAVPYSVGEKEAAAPAAPTGGLGLENVQVPSGSLPEKRPFLPRASTVEQNLRNDVDFQQAGSSYR